MDSQSKNTISFCRLCANIIEDTQQKDLFHKANQFVLEQIKELTGLTIKEMPRQMMPRFFCDDCKIELPRAYEFRRRIIKTQSYFKSKEFKNKLRTQHKFKTFPTAIVKEKTKTGNLDNSNPFEGDSSDKEADNVSAMDYDETLIKDEMLHATSESDDENPINANITFRKTSNLLKKSDVNASNKTSHTDNDASQKFDAVFLPLKKEDNEVNAGKISENESDKDALEEEEEYSADGSEDSDFEMKYKAKKKYPKKPPSNDSTKPEAPKDPRKNPLFCFICSTTLKTTHAFKVHCRKLHKGEKIFKCDSCEETFLRIKSLIRHNRIHIGGKLFECRYCDMSFNAPTTRIHHERAKHTKDWPFLCPICGKSFITTTRGKEHMTVHTKERPYKCDLCKTAYLQRNNFKKHRRSELHKNNEKKFLESMGNVSNENPAKEDKKENEQTENKN